MLRALLSALPLLSAQESARYSPLTQNRRKERYAIAPSLGRTGKELWSAKLEAGGYAVPVTYQGRHGKQYVVIVTGGNPSIVRVASDAVVAFSVP